MNQPTIEEILRQFVSKAYQPRGLEDAKQAIEEHYQERLRQVMEKARVDEIGDPVLVSGGRVKIVVKNSGLLDRSILQQAWEESEG